jgi:hypothetical protein
MILVDKLQSQRKNENIIWNRKTPTETVNK